MVPFLIVTILVFNSIESLAFLQRDFLKSKTNIIHASSIVVPRLSTEPDAVAPTNLDEKQVRPTYRDLCMCPISFSFSILVNISMNIA